MDKPIYQPPSPKTMGVEAYIEKYWRPRPTNFMHYGFPDFAHFVRQGMNYHAIALAFGFATDTPAANMVKLYKERNHS